MKATEQYFPVVLFTMLYKVVLTYKHIQENAKSVAIPMKAMKQHYPVVLFIMLYKVFQTFQFVDKYPKA